MFKRMKINDDEDQSGLTVNAIARTPPSQTNDEHMSLGRQGNRMDVDADGRMDIRGNSVDIVNGRMDVMDVDVPPYVAAN
jgi:hypothetical protein